MERLGALCVGPLALRATRRMEMDRGMEPCRRLALESARLADEPDRDPEMDPETTPLAIWIGRRVVQERQARGWSQMELARRIGVNRTAVGRWEAGARTPPLHRLVTTARLMGIGVEQLLPATAANPGGDD